MSRMYLILFGFLALVPGPVQAEERLRNFHVLGIGIDKYAVDKLNLQMVVSDVSAITDYLSRQDFDSGKPRRAPRLIFDHKAKKADVERELNDLPNWVADGGTVAIVYSGHGLRDGGHWYLAPHDTSIQHPDDTCVSDTTIVKALDNLIEKRRCRVLMILNSCHSGQMIVSARPLFDKYHDPAKGGLIILASSVPSETSWGAALGGVFNVALMNGLKMMQAHIYPTSSVSVKEIRRFLQTEVKEQLQFVYFKPPGIEWPDQFAVMECSLSIPETLGLTWADPKFTVKVKSSIPKEEPSPPGKTVAKNYASPVGIWICLRPLVTKFDLLTKRPISFVTDAQGKPVLEPMVLKLDADGTYEVLYQDIFGKKRTGAGRWRITADNRFTMTFDTGMDSLTIDKLDRSSFEIRKPGLMLDPAVTASIGMTQARNDPVWRFRRASESKK